MHVSSTLAEALTTRPVLYNPSFFVKKFSLELRNLYMGNHLVKNTSKELLLSESSVGKGDKKGQL